VSSILRSEGSYMERKIAQQLQAKDAAVAELQRLAAEDGTR